MFLLRGHFFIVVYVALELLCSKADCQNSLTTNCSEKIENDLSVPLIVHPARTEYNRYGGQSWIHETTEYVKKSQVTCSNVSFPLNFKNTQTVGNCTLLITNLRESTIPSAAFSGVSNVKVLILKNLGITLISPGAFGQHPIVEINLSGNKLTEISLGIFNSFEKLQNLDLSKNNIKSLLPNCLTGITHLKRLNISSNELSDFSFNILDPSITQIDYFDISFNNIIKFNLDNSTEILNLWLNNNQIEEIDFCPLMFGMLHINNNFLETLPEGNCGHSQNRLNTLDMSFNNISKIKQFYFTNANNLQYLYLNHNNISDISTAAFFNLTKLKTLNLSENNLEQFQHGTFDSLQNLEVLDLSSNNIKNIKTVLHALQKLKELYLQNNKINTIDLSIHFNFPKLNKICFYNNNFSCDNLIKIFQSVNHSLVIQGNTRNSSNIHGIACSDNQNIELLDNINFENVKLKMENVITSLLKETNNKNNDERDVIKDYFNFDFKNSNFYKFMANFQESIPIKFNETELFKYFNNDFEQSKFYKYLESLKDNKNLTDLNKNMYNYFNYEFKNSGFVKYLEDLKYNKVSINEDFSNSSLNRYFNKDFESSKFYKYMEGLKIPSSYNTQDNPNFQKLVDIENPEYKKMMVVVTVNTIIISIICFLFGVLIYKMYFGRVSIPREQVELLQA